MACKWQARNPREFIMAVYRYQVVSVGMWRGKIKRWNTTIHSSLTGYETTLRQLFQKSGWKNPGDITGACSGGVASISCYPATGGAPINVTTYFDWETPSTWIPYTSDLWAAVDPTTPLDASGESALVVVGNMASLSSTGKPVTTRKYLHAIPSRTAAAYADPDVDAATQAAFAAAWNTTWMKNPAGVSPATTACEPYYMNHQRVRGRRKPTAAVAAQAFSFGVLAGGGATTSGQGTPFPGGEF